MVLWVFDGDMVGKWTNEPCNGVDEVVNHFWVLTVTLLTLNKDVPQEIERHVKWHPVEAR